MTSFGTYGFFAIRGDGKGAHTQVLRCFSSPRYACCYSYWCAIPAAQHIIIIGRIKYCADTTLHALRFKLVIINSSMLFRASERETNVT